MGGKGPRLTTQIGLPGRYVVFMPGASGCGVSRRLDDSERERLRTLGGALRPEEAGLIIRTAAEGAPSEALERDLRFLQRVWGGLERRVETATAPALVYRESELAIRVVRDLLSTGVRGRHRRRRGPPSAGEELRPSGGARAGGESRCFTGMARALFDLSGIEGKVRSALDRRVELPSGGYLAIDHTEAMTVIDVNTGRFVGRRFLEDTTLKTNLEACREIVHQLRLRDIGGIIVIDFIDMTSRANRAAIVAALEGELARDRTKTYVVEVSPLGLVEMTRQNVTRGLREAMTCVCPLCRGEGRVLSRESALIAVERSLEDMARKSGTPGLRVEVHPRVMSLLTAGRPSRFERLEQDTGHFVILVPAGDTVPLDHVIPVGD